MAGPALKAEVAEQFKLVGATAETQVSHPSMGVIRLADVNLEQAETLVKDGCTLLQPIAKKDSGK